MKVSKDYKVFVIKYIEVKSKNLPFFGMGAWEPSRLRTKKLFLKTEMEEYLLYVLQQFNSDNNISAPEFIELHQFTKDSIEAFILQD